MDVLLIKTSSLGDLIHVMPAIRDAAAACPEISIDWVVEESFAPLCDWHPDVRETIPIAFRRWRRRPIAGLFGGPLSRFRQRLSARRYDAVIDAQGLYKSAVIARLANGPRYGFDKRSAREGLAAQAYDHPIRVDRDISVIDRNRHLFAAALGYERPVSQPEYGLLASTFPEQPLSRPYILFLHGGTWFTKRWPLHRWRALAAAIAPSDYRVLIPWYNAEERHRAELAADGFGHVHIRQVDLRSMGAAVAHAAGVVSVETGFAHLAAAFGRPGVTLYGPTSHVRNATRGENQIRLRAGFPCSPCKKKHCAFTANLRQPAPCMEQISEAEVWSTLSQLMANELKTPHPLPLASAGE